MNINKLLASIFALLICCELVSTPQITDSINSIIASSEDMYSGSCGENATFSFDEATGTLTISGTGDMEEYGGDYIFVPWLNYRDNIKTVIIQEGITSIGDCSFIRCPYLESVTIPNSVTHINDKAFGYCTSLKSIDIPNSVTKIGKFAFGGCTSLSRINIPNSVTEICQNAFDGCPSLKEIKWNGNTYGVGEFFKAFNNRLKS